MSKTGLIGRKSGLWLDSADSTRRRAAEPFTARAARSPWTVPFPVLVRKPLTNYFVYFLQMASSSRNPRSRSSSTGSRHHRPDEGSDSEATHFEQPQPLLVAPPAWFPDHTWLHFPAEAEFDSPNILYARVSQLQGRQPCTVCFLDLGDPILRE